MIIKSRATGLIQHIPAEQWNGIMAEMRLHGKFIVLDPNDDNIKKRPSVKVVMGGTVDVLQREKERAALSRKLTTRQHCIDYLSEKGLYNGESIDKYTKTEWKQKCILTIK